MTLSLRRVSAGVYQCGDFIFVNNSKEQQGSKIENVLVGKNDTYKTNLHTV